VLWIDVECGWREGAFYTAAEAGRASACLCFLVGARGTWFGLEPGGLSQTAAGVSCGRRALQIPEGVVCRVADLIFILGCV
jgi:hypothetical protein